VVKSPICIILSTPSQTGQTSVYGSHWYDAFTGTTSGTIGLLLNEKTSVSPSDTMYTILSGTPIFTSTGGLYMPNIGDSIEFTMNYYVLGHTSFGNLAASMAGGTIGNYNLQYQLDTGSGFGSLKTLNGTNLSSESISPSVGFKLRIRITTTIANITAITSLRIFTTTNATAQYTQYPLETVYPTLTFTGLATSSEIRIYSSGTTNELTGVENSSTSFAYNYTWTGTDIPVDIVIFNIQYNPIYYYGYLLTNTNAKAFDENS